MRYQVSFRHKCVPPLAAFIGIARHCEVFLFSRSGTVAGGMQLLGVSGSLVTLEPYIRNHQRGKSDTQITKYNRNVWEKNNRSKWLEESGALEQF